jgi:hypothetical protein
MAALFALCSRPRTSLTLHTSGAHIGSHGIEYEHFLVNADDLDSMKHCTYCGKEYPDDVVGVCPVDGNPLRGAGEVQALSDGVQQPRAISPTEQRFWQRMTFREFAILIVRLQALWVLFPVVVELTYLPGYFSTLFPARRFDVLPLDMKQTFYLALLRIALRAAVGIGAFLYADRLVSWLAKGLVKGTPEK